MYRIALLPVQLYVEKTRRKKNSLPGQTAAFSDETNIYTVYEVYMYLFLNFDIYSGGYTYLMVVNRELVVFCLCACYTVVVRSLRRTIFSCILCIFFLILGWVEVQYPTLLFLLLLLLLKD